MSRAFVLVLVLLLGLTVPVLAQQNTQTITLTDIQTAQLLITNNHLDEAKAILLQKLSSMPEHSETLFLLGTIAAAEKDYDQAIAYYRHLLANEPDAERVRLELARAFFLKDDYENAARQFRFARAGDVSDVEKSNIDGFLSAISQLREWSFNFSLVAVPDSNENAGPGESLITIYGLPFTLSSAARQKSGIGAAFGGGGEWSPSVVDNLKARVGLNVYRLDFGGRQFDDMTLSTYAGPQWLFPDWNVSALFTGFQRWYGNRPYAVGAGGKLAAEIGITSDWLVGASAGAQDIFYKDIPSQSGPLFSLQAQAAYVLSPSSQFQVQAGFNRQNAEDKPYAYSGYWVGAGYSQDFPLGFSAGLQANYYWTDYDAALAAFGVARTDRIASVSLSLLNRRLEYHGFTPRVSYSFTDQESNLPLYRYTRNQFQIGLTTEF